MSNLTEKDPLTAEDLDELLEDLVEAKKILDNPQLLKRLKQHAEKRSKEIDSIQDLRALSNEVSLNFTVNKKDEGKVESIKELRKKKKEMED